MTKGLSLDDHLDLMRKGVADAILCISDKSRSDLDSDRITQLAVVKAIENIGETAGDIMAEHPAFAEAETGIDWRGWKKARNRLNHGYHSIDYDLVWQMVTGDIPKLSESPQAIADYDDLKASGRMRDGPNR